MKRTIGSRVKGLASPWLALAFSLVSVLGANHASCTVVEKQMKLRDVSGKASPIRVSGYLTFRDDDSKVTRFSYQENFSARNVSGKGILLMVLHLEASGAGGSGQDEFFSQEYFFGPALEPGAVEIHDAPGIAFGQTVNGIPVSGSEPDPRPIAKVRVEFVQFSDGSSWGDIESAKDVLDTRRKTLLELDVLEHFYEQAGENAFLAELSRAEIVLPCINSVKSVCQKKMGDSNCAHEIVRRMIEFAKTHEAAANSGSAHPVAICDRCGNASPFPGS